MKNSRASFNFLDKNNHTPVGYKEITCHLIFDVEMDLTRKFRYVSEGHLDDPPSFMNYVIVVSCDIFLLSFLIAALNDLDILSGDIQNAYFNAPTKGNFVLNAGDDLKYDQVKVVVVVRALYGLKLVFLAWGNNLSEILGNHLGYQSSLADTKYLFKESIDNAGNEYYTYILVYIDDFIIVDKNP